VSVTLSAFDLTDNTTRTATKLVCVSDTTPPAITIVRPVAGAIVRGDDFILEVRISDAVDKNISNYEVDLGTHVVSPLDPSTGQSRQRLQDAPKTSGPVNTTITVRARDASGNVATQSVNFSEVFDKHHDDH